MFDNRLPLREKMVLEDTSQGVILEIRFEGQDNTSRGHEMGPFIRSAIEEHRPAALVLNLLGCRAIFDNDVGSMVWAFRDPERGINLPCSIVAKGAAARSLCKLLDLTKMKEVFDIVVVNSVGEALEHAKRAASGKTA